MQGSNTPINPEFADLVIEEAYNPYRECIQGLANEPITVRMIVERADTMLRGEPGFEGLGDYSLSEIVARLVANRPRVAIIQGSADHPAHLLDHEHMLRVAARIWQNGGVPFTFGVPVICDGTAQNNIGQSYSLVSRNQTAATVNINFEGHSYHAAYVLSGCDKSPTGVLSGLASAARARTAPGRGTAPAWAMFAPSHVLRGGTIPPGTRDRLRAIEDKATAAGDPQLAADIAENARYILQCSSDEAFIGQLKRAVSMGLIDRTEQNGILDELAAATCHENGGVCAFNGTGNSSRTLVASLGLTPREVELLTDTPATKIVNTAVDQFFRCFNRPDFGLLEVLAGNYANAIRIHGATGSSTNLMMHMPAIMRYAGFDVTLSDYEAVANAHDVPDIFAHSLTEGRDTFALAQQFEAGHNRGMESIYKVLSNLGVPLNLDAPTMTGHSWRERTADLDQPVSPDLPEERAVIRARPVREISGTDVLRGNFLSTAVLKVAAMSDSQYKTFDDRVFVVRYFANEYDCNADLTDPKLMDKLRKIPGLDEAVLARLRAVNGGDGTGDFDAMIEDGTLAFAFVIGGQGPKAYGMPEMFSPSQNLRHHGVLERSSILMTDGRYSGVTKGACIGHVTPEAYEGGAIGALVDGDLLWVRLGGKGLDILDREHFLAGEKSPMTELPLAERADIITERKRMMDQRQLEVASSSLMDEVTDAERGVVPGSVDRRATHPSPITGKARAAA
ncbi:MAG: dihydroxy-acid dehydratase [Rhodospirillaceae bacterium]|nr:dihydroxy-acid dehydratase [Rhodospirillaceae bacterium]